MRTFAKTASIFMVLLVVFSFVGCGKKAFGLSYDLGFEPENIDPQAAVDKASLTVINNIMEGLLRVDETGKIVPASAKSYTISDDKLTYVFTLQDDLKWENGEKLTADDFAFALKRLLMKSTNSSFSKLFFGIKNGEEFYNNVKKFEEVGVKSDGKNTLTVTLNKQNDDFLRLLTMPCVSPCNQKFFEETRGKYGLEEDTVLANGPFVMKKWYHDETIRLVKNDKYYDKNATEPSSVNLFINTELTEIPTKSTVPSSENSSNTSENSSVAQQEFEKDFTLERLTKEKTLSAMVDGFVTNKLDETNFSKYAVQNSTWGLAFNNKVPILQNKNLRSAISRAFSRPSYEELLTESLQSAYAIVPNSVMVGEKTYREIVGSELAPMYNAKEAFELYQKALAELKNAKILKGDQVRSLNLLVPALPYDSLSEYFRYPSQLLQQDLGIFVNIIEASPSEYQKKLRQGDFDCVLVNLVAQDNTQRSILSQFHSNSSQNFYGYKNAEIDKLIDDAGKKTNIYQANENYKKVEQMLINDGVFIPMYYKTDYFVTKNTVENLVYNNQTGLIYFKKATIKK